MKVKVVYSWEIGRSDQIVELDQLAKWISKNNKFSILSISEHKEDIIELTEEQRQDLEVKFRKKYQGKAILNTEEVILDTEEEKDDDIYYPQIAFYFFTSMAALKYIFGL